LVEAQHVGAVRISGHFKTERTEKTGMPTIRHAISIGTAPTRIHPLISSAHGFAQWWAAGVAEDRSTGIVELSFSKGDTAYRLEPVRDTPPDEVAWLCQNGKEWQGTKLQFQWTFDQKNTLLKVTHSGWSAETDYFVRCNTTWGALMFRLKEAAEGKGPGPFFATYGLE
jgi:hypothetical protein